MRAAFFQKQGRRAFSPPVAAFRYQFVPAARKYSAFFPFGNVFQAGKRKRGTEVIQTKVFTVVRYVLTGGADEFV